MYDVQFEQAKFVKLPKKGRKKVEEKDKENVPVNNKFIMYNGVEWYQTQLDQLHSLLQTFVAMTNTINDYNYVQQQQLFPIFNNHKSILLAKPQTPKSKRASNRVKKNSSALSHE